MRRRTGGGGGGGMSGGRGVVGGPDLEESQEEGESWAEEKEEEESHKQEAHRRERKTHRRRRKCHRRRIERRRRSQGHATRHSSHRHMSLKSLQANWTECEVKVGRYSYVGCTWKGDQVNNRQISHGPLASATFWEGEEECVRVPSSEMVPEMFNCVNISSWGRVRQSSTLGQKLQ